MSLNKILQLHEQALHAFNTAACAAFSSNTGMLASALHNQRALLYKARITQNRPFFNPVNVNDIENSNRLSDMFWRLYGKNDICYEDLVNFLSINVHYDDIEGCIKKVLNKWKFDIDFKISSTKWHYRLFNNVNLDCIPSLDNKHNNDTKHNHIKNTIYYSWQYS